MQDLNLKIKILQQELDMNNFENEINDNKIYKKNEISTEISLNNS